MKVDGSEARSEGHKENVASRWGRVEPHSPRRVRFRRGRALATGGGLTGLMALAHAWGDALNSMLSALLPTLQARFGLSETMLALLVATLWFSSSMMQPVFGAVSDRVERRVVGSLAIVLNSVMLSLVGVAPTLYLLFGVLLVGGLGSAALHPVGTHLARSVGGRHKALAIGLFSGGGMLGFAIGPVIILYVISNFGTAAAPWLMVPGLVLGALMFTLIPSDDKLRGNDAVWSVTHAPGSPIFDTRLFSGAVGALAVAGVLAAMGLVTFTSAVPLWLVAEGGVSPQSSTIGWTLAAFSGSAAVGGVVSGAFTRTSHRRFVIPSTMALAVVPLIGMLFLPVSSPGFFAAVMVAGALVYANVPLMIVSAQDLAPHAMGTASGMLMGFTAGTAGILYIGVGGLQEVIGLAPAMVTSFLVMIPGAALAFYVLTKHREALVD